MSRTFLVFTSITVVIAACALVVVAYAHIPADQIAPGVHIASVDLSGMSREAAVTAVSALARDLESSKFTLQYVPNAGGHEYSWPFTARELGVSVNVDATVTKALETGRDGAANRVSEILHGKAETRIVGPVSNIDSEAMRVSLKKIAHVINRAAVNPRVSVNDAGVFTCGHGKPGVMMDIDACAAAVTASWTRRMEGHEEESGAKDTAANSARTSGAQNSDNSNSKDNSTSVAVVTHDVEPNVTPDDIAKIDGAIGEMKTRIRGTSQRVRNVTIATQHINGTLLPPDGIFSYNKIVGRRSEEGGYQKAIVFVKGRHVEDVGGGICQTASTLYNAVLKAGLKVIRRQPHCTPVVYVPYGLDATVAYGAVDFQFQNDSAFPVYIYARAKGRSLTFRLYSKSDAGRKVVLEKVKQSTSPNGVTVVQDKTLAPGKRVVKDKGARGYHIVWRRTIIESGKPPRSETITSHYRPISEIVAVGPGAQTRPLAPVQAPSGVAPLLSPHNPVRGPGVSPQPIAPGI